MKEAIDKKKTVLSGEVLAPCLIHGRRCRVTAPRPPGPPSERALLVNVSGPVCLPWCSGGSRQGLAHPATTAWHIWTADQNQQKYDITICENSPNMPPEMFQGAVASFAHTVSVIFGPEDLGWPARRKRLMMASFNRDSVVWIGPGESESIKEHFLSLFQRRCVRDGSVFAGIDQDSNVVSLRVSYGEKVGYVSDPSEAPLEELFSGTQRERIIGYKALQSQKKDLLIPTMCFDATQNPRQRAVASPWLPVITRSCLPMMLSHGDDRGYIFTGRECAFSQGWPSIPFAENEAFRSAVGFDIHALSLPTQRALLGNGMSLPALTSWIAYLLSHTLRRDVVAEYLPCLKVLTDADGMDDDMGVSPESESQPGPGSMPEEQEGTFDFV